MRRPIPILVLFPILAATAGLALLAGLVSVLISPADMRDLYDLIATCSTLGAHGMAQGYLESRESRIKARAEADGLPGWVGAQAEKNSRKAIPYLRAGYLLQCFVMWSRADGFKGPVTGAWFDGLLGFNLAFQVGAFVGEYAIMAAQARLMRDVGGWITKPDARLVDSVA